MRTKNQNTNSAKSHKGNQNAQNNVYTTTLEDDFVATTITTQTVDALPILANELMTDFDCLVIVASCNKEVAKICDNLRFFVNPANIAVAALPNPDCYFFSNDTQSQHSSSCRINTIGQAMVTKNSLQQKLIVVASANALAFKTAPENFLREHFVNIKVNDDLLIEDLSKMLTKMGYEREDNAENCGSFSVKGDVVRIANKADTGIHIDFFGDIVEQIKVYNLRDYVNFTSTQTDSALILPISESVICEETQRNFKNKCISGMTAKEVAIKMSQASSIGLLFEGKLSTFFDYMPDNSAILHCSNPHNVFAEVYKEINACEDRFNIEIHNHEAIIGSTAADALRDIDLSEPDMADTTNTDEMNSMADVSGLTKLWSIYVGNGNKMSHELSRFPNFQLSKAGNSTINRAINSTIKAH